MKPGSRVSGTFLQQNAAMYLGLGFLPDWVRLRSLTTDTMIELEWSINMRALACIEGFLRTGIVDTDMDIVDLAYGEGVAHYLGGEVITSATTPSTTTYVAKDTSPDKRSAYVPTADAINTWSLDTPASRTGHWNDECSTTYVGVGSRICVDGVWATVIAITSNGEQDDEVTLNRALPSGNIEFLGPMYDYTTQATGTTTKPGILISDTTYLLDAATDTIMFEAGLYA